jgi:hypothetical protein
MGVNAMLLTRAFGPSEGFTVFKPKKSLMCHNSKRPGFCLNKAIGSTPAMSLQSTDGDFAKFSDLKWENPLAA